jgi:hypothetical protein
MELREALLIVLAFLFPLTVYCLVLASVNRRRHPFVVSGRSDFLGLVLALSGFLVAGGPAILSNLVSVWRGPGRLSGVPDPESGYDWRPVVLRVLLAVYFAALVAAVALVLRQRRGVTSVYNMDPDRFDEVLGRALDQLGYSWARAGNRFYLRVPAPLPSAKPEQPAVGQITAAGAVSLEAPVHTAPLAPAAVPEQNAVIEVDPFPAMHHVTVRWGLVGPSLRQEVEGEVTRALAGVVTRENPSGGWFLSAAATLFLIMSAVVLFLLVTNVLFHGV